MSNYVVVLHKCTKHWVLQGQTFLLLFSVLQIEEHIITGERHKLAQTLGLKFLAEERAALLVDQNKQSLCWRMRNAVSFVKVL